VTTGKGFSYVGFGDSSSGGFLTVAAGKRILTLGCWDKEEKAHEFPIDLEAGGFYRFKRMESTPCDAWQFEVERPALVQGSIDGPEIQIRVPGDESPRPTLQVELSPGKHELIAVCRDVTRTTVRESTVNISLELNPGEIYRLYADFDPTSHKCDVHPKLLTKQTAQH
jgi:hypothetical protein